VGSPFQSVIYPCAVTGLTWTSNIKSIGGKASSQCQIAILAAFEVLLSVARIVPRPVSNAARDEARLYIMHLIRNDPADFIQALAQVTNTIVPIEITRTHNNQISKHLTTKNTENLSVLM
jgi:hypothetical protein